jgi:hypothetical protein
VSAVELELEVEIEPEVLWRFDQFVHAGFSEGQASILASRADLDWHRTIALVQAGCPPELVLRIIL